MNNLIPIENKLSSVTAALSVSPYQALKPSYGFINTLEVAKRFERQGWTLVDASQNKVRKAERSGFQKHILTFEHESIRLIDGLSKSNESKIRLQLLNSHDGSSSYELVASIFRLVCKNGLQVSAGSFGKVRVVHSGNVIKRLDHAIEEFMERIPLVGQKALTMQGITLTEERKIELATLMTQTRLEKIEYDMIDYLSALTPVRGSDIGNDLFSVFNVLQEKVMRGGISYRQSESDSHVWKKSRAVTSVTQGTKINRKLWDIAEKFAV